MMKRVELFARALILSAPAVMLTTGAIAGEKEDAVIAKVVNAYGGSALTNARSLRFQVESKNAFPGQGYTSGYVEFTPLKQDIQFDLENNRASAEAWSSNYNFSFHTRTVSIGDDIVAVNYNTGDYQPAAAPDYYTAFGPNIRSTDTLLAYELSQRPDTAEHLGERTYLGRPHELISFEIPNSPPLTLYVDAESGWISKMARETAFGDLSYQFSDHAKSGGVGYGRNFEFFVGEDANIVSLNQTLSVNTVRDSVFRIDRGVDEEPARVDTSEMTVDEIAEGTHLAGTGNAYTMFVDAGDYVIGVGGYAGLADRFTAYREATGSDEPLRYQIVTHHHTDHLGGMADALELGATFVTPANAVDNLNTAAGADIPEDRLMIIEDAATIGPVEVYDIATNHAESYALAYVAPGIAFQADHYNGLYDDAVAPAGSSAVSLKNAIDGLDLNVETLLSAHGRKAVSWSEFESAVSAYNPDGCPSGRPICAKS